MLYKCFHSGLLWVSDLWTVKMLIIWLLDVFKTYFVYRHICMLTATMVQDYKIQNSSMVQLVCIIGAISFNYILFETRRPLVHRTTEAWHSIGLIRLFYSSPYRFHMDIGYSYKFCIRLTMTNNLIIIMGCIKFNFYSVSHLRAHLQIRRYVPGKTLATGYPLPPILEVKNHNKIWMSFIYKWYNFGFRAC